MKEVENENDSDTAHEMYSIIQTSSMQHKLSGDGNDRIELVTCVFDDVEPGLKFYTDGGSDDESAQPDIEVAKTAGSSEEVLRGLTKAQSLIFGDDEDRNQVRHLPDDVRSIYLRHKKVF